ncbi:MAG: N-acetylmuramoyl-L-alanine amidase [Eubacteriales bacterium]|nr:N-acetylmuramoyl-L-alanine amidase [Eubacteriales bacterium]
MIIMRIGKKIRINKRRAIISLLIMVALIAVGVTAAAKYLDSIPTELREGINIIETIPIITDFIKEGSLERPGDLRKIKYIVIHETGNRGRNADAASHNNYLHTEADNQRKSWHYTVDDHEIYYHIPDNEIAFHAGDGLRDDGGNLNGIGIEMCVNPENDYEKTLVNTAKLAALLITSYDLDISRVKKHEDFSGKYCPEILLAEDRWEEFVEMVKQELAE